MLYLLEEDRDRTAILIDIGYLCTDVMAVEGDAVIFQKTLPVGGGHIAADVAEGLSIPLESAEQIKREYVYGISTISQSYTVSGGEGVKTETFTQEQVAAVLEPRVDEIADMIQECINDSGIKLGSWSTIYLTGGGLSLNRGGRDYLSAKLEKPVRDTVKRTIKSSPAPSMPAPWADGPDHRHHRGPKRHLQRRGGRHQGLFQKFAGRLTPRTRPKKD